MSCLQWVAIQFILFSNSPYVQVQILAWDLDSLYKLNLVFPSLALSTLASTLTLQCPGCASVPWLPQLERQQAFSQSFSHPLPPPLYCRLPCDKVHKIRELTLNQLLSQNFTTFQNLPLLTLQSPLNEQERQIKCTCVCVCVPCFVVIISERLSELIPSY